MKQNITQPVQARITLLERRLYFAYLIIITVVLIQIGSFVWSPAQASNESAESANKVIKTRGIIIVDEQGRERILLGAPIPAAKNRVRTDLARVKEIWGKRYPSVEKYMEYYKDYNHNVNGMLILDQNGFDRLAVGDQITDPNIGKRIGTQTGLIFNDEQGDERGGFGLLKVKDNYRVVMGMDSNKGNEGLTLSLHDDGPIGLNIRSDNNSTYLGFLPPKRFENETTESFNGILMKQDKNIKYQINTLEKK
ncbi:MAG TPA: hypothetical protein VF692_07710 [Pyrinomonadaceae bacterium]|jgi:hypothetical protein